MDREILFRGKRMEKGENREWVQGCLVEGKEHVFNGNSFICPSVTSASVENAELSLGGFVEVDSSTVGQYTGRTDKNDVKIFEGDICRCWMMNDERQNEDIGLYVVKWNTDNAMFDLEGDKENLEFGFLSECEVVGNIYDTPELLKGD